MSKFDVARHIFICGIAGACASWVFLGLVVPGDWEFVTTSIGGGVGLMAAVISLINQETKQ